MVVLYKFANFEKLGMFDRRQFVEQHLKKGSKSRTEKLPYFVFVN